jgi:membrane protein required for colicin V production
MDVNYIDITIVVIILVTALIGLMRGLVWMAIFLATWTAAILLALKFKDQLATALPIKLENEVMQTGLAALLIFLGVLIAGAIINAILHRIIKSVGLGTFDSILGTGLGILLGALAVTLLTMLLGLTELPKQDAWNQSKLIPKFQNIATWIKTKIPEDLNEYIDSNLVGSNTSATQSTTDIITPESPSSN